jgi:hypothetical protein
MRELKISRSDWEAIGKKAEWMDADGEIFIHKFADLGDWFKEKWVDISRKDKDGRHPPCGRSDASKGAYPKCRPSKRVSDNTPSTSRGMSAKAKKKAVEQKRRAESKPRNGKKPHMTSHHSLKNEKNKD